MEILRKPPGQEHSGIVYRYPRSRFQPGQDMIKIDIFEYERSDNQTFSIGSILQMLIKTTYATMKREKDKEEIPVGGTIDLSKVNIPSTTQSFLANKSKLKKSTHNILTNTPKN